jgi:very-short-patch-repair endonuclease
MDVRFREMAAAQTDVVARWQLVEAGWAHDAVDDWARRNRWRAVYPGVYALTQAPLTRRQRWTAATLSAPGTALAAASAAACWGFRPWAGSFEVVVRPGSGGPRLTDGLLAMRSLTLAGELTTSNGIAITTPDRTLIDLSANVRGRPQAKMVREAIRLKTTTAYSLLGALSRHRGRRGTATLRELALRYRDIPIARTKSDAEAAALEVLAGAGITAFANNVIVAGEEADLVDRDRRLIIEIDGPQFHMFLDEGERKQRLWQGSGWTVERLSSGDVFDAPERLVALARR